MESDQTKVDAADVDPALKQAEAALIDAKADYERALLVAKERPYDVQAQRRLRSALRAGQQAWQVYRQARERL